MIEGCSENDQDLGTVAAGAAVSGAAGGLARGRRRRRRFLLHGSMNLVGNVGGGLFELLDGLPETFGEFRNFPGAKRTKATTITTTISVPPSNAAVCMHTSFFPPYT